MLVKFVADKYTKYVSEPMGGKEELYAMALQHVFESIYKFDETLGYKAYSYLGTICRHFCTTLSEKSYKKESLMDDIMVYNQEEVEQRVKEHYVPDDHTPYVIPLTLFDLYTQEIRKKLDSDHTLTINEVKLGESLYQIFNNHDELFNQVETTYTPTGKPRHSDLYKPKYIASKLKEVSGLSQKEIKDSQPLFDQIFITVARKFNGFND